MALDRPDDDFEAGDARPDQHLPRRSADSGGAAAAARAEAVEPRTREEYDEVLRAADRGPADRGPGDGGATDGGPGDAGLVTAGRLEVGRLTNLIRPIRERIIPAGMR